MLTAIENGGNKLDNYDGYLTRNYTQFGFIPVARVAFNEQYAPENWNYEKFGKPDVIFFMHNGDSVETIAKNYRNYEKIDTSTLPLFEDYDQAYAYRDSLIEEKKQSNVKQKDSFEKGKDVIRHLTAARMAAEYGLQVQIIDNPNKDVHGYVSGDTVYLNRNSDKSILVTMVHELTHKTENTKFYKDIHTAAINWMHQTSVDMSAFRTVLQRLMQKTALSYPTAALTMRLQQSLSRMWCLARKRKFLILYTGISRWRKKSKGGLILYLAGTRKM